MHLPLRLGRGFTQSAKESMPIMIVPENVLTLIAAIHHMINRSRIFKAQLTRHQRRLAVRGTLSTCK
jgi:hypothetical protein